MKYLWSIMWRILVINLLTLGSAIVWLIVKREHQPLDHHMLNVLVTIVAMVWYEAKRK